MAGTTRIDIASNASAGNGTSMNLNVAGQYMLLAEATWSGGSIKVQVQSTKGTWIDVASSTLSANGNLLLQLPCGQVRGVVGGSATAVFASLLLIPTVITK